MGEVAQMPEPQQTEWVAGFPVTRFSFALKSVSKLYTDRKLKHDDYVRGIFEGRVQSARLIGDEERFSAEIGVTDADITAKCPHCGEEL